MAISLDTLANTREDKPAIGIVYGGAGVGKTTLAAGAPNPVLAFTERGASQLELPGWEIKTFGDMMGAIDALYDGAAKYGLQTFIVDSLDAFEPMVIREACERNRWPDVESPGYGKGWLAVMDVWREYIDGIEAVRDRGMQVVQIAHAEVRKFSSPISSDYDRFQLKLYNKAAALLTESADWVGFYTFRVVVVKEDAGFGRKTTRGTGGGQRVLFLEERPGFIAKSRYQTPSSLDIGTVKDAAQNPGQVWAKLAEYLPPVGP